MGVRALPPTQEQTCFDIEIQMFYPTDKGSDLWLCRRKQIQLVTLVRVASVQWGCVEPAVSGWRSDGSGGSETEDLEARVERQSWRELMERDLCVCVRVCL